MRLHAPNVIWGSNRWRLSPSLPRTCSSKIISIIDLCTILGILALHTLKGSKSTRGLLWAYPEETSLLPRHPSEQAGDHYHDIYGFNTRSSHSLGKIRLQCKIENLKSKVTCNVIERRHILQSLSRWPWIHANQLNRPLHIAPVLQVRRWRYCNPNGVRWDVTIQRNGELLHRLSTL